VKTTPRQKLKIEQAAELYFNGHSQDAIAERLGVTQGRVSQMQAHPDWAKTIERLEDMRERVQADLALKQKQEYSDELEAWMAQSKKSSTISFAIAAKVLRIVNNALDVAMVEPDKIAAAEKIKNIHNLVKASVALQERADTAMNQRLSIAEVAKHFEGN